MGNIDYTDGGFGIGVKGDLVFLSADSYGLAIVNVSDPASPVLVSETDFGVLVRTIAIQDDLVFIVLASNSLRILNISDPSSPSQIASFTSPQSDQYTGVIVLGETLFIADRGRGVDVVNISQSQEFNLTTCCSIFFVMLCPFTIQVSPGTKIRALNSFGHILDYL